MTAAPGPARTRRPLVGYLAAQAVSLTGTRLSMIAVPWFVLTTTGSATRTGLAAFCEMAPLVTLQAMSGPLVDRLGARRVAVVCDVLSVVAVGAVPVLHARGVLTFPVLLVLVGLAGALRGPGEVAKHALVPVVVDHAVVPTERVTGLAGAVERTATLAGAAAAGGLVAGVGAANALAVDAASFLVSAVLLARSVPPQTVRLAAAHPPAGVRGGVAAYAGELRDGWTFLRGDRLLLGIGVMVACSNLLDAAFAGVLLPVWARDTGAGVAVVGLFSAVFGGASIVGAVTAARVGERLRRLPVYVVGFLVGGVPRFVAMALDAPVATLLALAVVGGIGSGFLNPILGAVLFERTPEGLVGRVSATNLAMCWSLIPFGGLLGGAAVGGLGISGALLVVGAAYLVVALAPALHPMWRELDRRPERTAAGSAASGGPA